MRAFVSRSAYPGGAPTQNGRFHRAAQDAKAGTRQPERVHEYEKLRTGHDLPWSKGGTSFIAENVQLLCARHNIAKRDRIV